MLQVKNQRSGTKTVCGFFFNFLNFFNYFNFNRKYDGLKSKSACILLNKNINFNKNETEPKMENPTHSFRETNLALQHI